MLSAHKAKFNIALPLASSKKNSHMELFVLFTRIRERKLPSKSQGNNDIDELL